MCKPMRDENKITEFRSLPPPQHQTVAFESCQLKFGQAGDRTISG